LIEAAPARVAALFVFHAVVFAACYAFAWLLRFEFTIPPEYIETFRVSFPVVVGTQLLIGGVFSFYRGWWRYVGIGDVVRLVFGITTALAVLTAAWYAGLWLQIGGTWFRAPRGVLLIDWAFTLLSLFGARVAIRLGRDRFRSDESAPATKRVIIVGAGDTGEVLARGIEHRPQLGMKVVAFVDDQRVKWGAQIRGARVYGPIANIGAIAEDVGATEALIAIPSASGKRVREIIHHLSAAEISFKTMPGIDQIMSGKVHVTQLRPVNVEDLLRRKRIDLPGDPVRELFRGKRVLVTGAGGTIGSELAVQIAHFEPATLALAERSEYALYEVTKRLSREVPWLTPGTLSSNLADIRDEATMRQLFEDRRPEIVLHAAAHKHVPLGEQNPLEYLRNNALATRAVAELAAEHGAERFVFISTDKAINPTSVMGATKRAGEILLLDLQSSMKVTIVRFGNVIGSSGSVIPLFMEQIAAGGPVTVTHPDVTRYFIRTSEAISLVLQAATLGDGGQVFMLDMGEPIKIADLARDLIQLSNHTEDEIPIHFTGLRPGEKLFEEIRLQGEDIQPTLHPQIVITNTTQVPSDQVANWTRRARSGAIDARAALRDLIAEYEAPQSADKRQPVVVPYLPKPASAVV
jgi:FlaA1/EpsC-like NDP-sugar epimerase